MAVEERKEKEEEKLEKKEEKKDEVESVDLKKKSGKKKVIVTILGVVIVIAIGVVLGLYFREQNDDYQSIGTDKKEVKSKYEMSGNSLSEFDLVFLKLEKQNVNKVYSPLSIKYALAMLAEGADGETKEQIERVIGKYVAQKYTNSLNMSFANALFIKDTYKDNIKKEYIAKLMDKYNAEVIDDSFANATKVNNWVSDKTLGLIKNLYDDQENISSFDYMLINALAIDMEWVNRIQADSTNYKKIYSAHYPHENYYDHIPMLEGNNYGTIKFDDKKINAKAVEFGASINNYNAVSEIGEESIRKTVGDGYKEWVAGNPCGLNFNYKSVDEFLDNYIKELDSNYKDVKISTDFYEYHDENVKVFAKDLKEYDGTTLQYVGVMPVSVKLEDFVKQIKATDLTKIINSLKEIKSENYEEGKVIQIKGSTPVFNYADELDLLNDLKNIGIKDIFNQSKANLSKLTTSKGSFIADAKHKANIEFSNEGIKAAAVTSAAGMGSASCEYDYLYDVPIEKIDLTFENPYLYLIRDKKSGEVWFVGTVYEPTVNTFEYSKVLNEK